MNARFFRDEAARIRGMTGTIDREATKLRLLAMAADYEARAGVANEMTGPDPGEAKGDRVEPTQNVASQITLGKNVATGLKETV